MLVNFGGFGLCVCSARQALIYTRSMEVRNECGVEKYRNEIYNIIYTNTFTRASTMDEIITVPERPLFILHCYFQSDILFSHCTVRQHTAYNTSTFKEYWGFFVMFRCVAVRNRNELRTFREKVFVVVVCVFVVCKTSNEPILLNIFRSPCSLISFSFSLSLFIVASLGCLIYDGKMMCAVTFKLFHFVYAIPILKMFMLNEQTLKCSECC